MTPCRRAVALAIVALSGAAQAFQDPAAPAPLAFEHVTVVDVERGRLLADYTVAVSGMRISAVGPSRNVPSSAAQRIDARGAFVIPGLWDMHVHLSSARSDELRVPLLLAHGITGVRAMSHECIQDCDGDPVNLATLRSWREQRARGTRVLPRIVASGPGIDGPRPTRIRNWAAADAAATAEAVRVTKERGGDFVKIASLLPRDAFFGAMREARSLGLRVAGHVPATVRPSEAAEAGMASFEHNMGVWEECSSQAPELYRQLTDIAAKGGPEAFARVSSFVTPEVMATYDESRCAKLFATLRNSGTWLVPTIVLRRGFAAQAHAASATDERLRYIPAEQRSTWKPAADFRTRQFGDANFAAREERLRREPWLVARAHRAGVGILAGTDLGNPYVFPGWALHEELELLVTGGLSPLDALRAATLNPARFLREADVFGTVAKGLAADFVLLEGNPLASISNTKRIRGLVVNGRYLDRAALDLLLAGVERAAAAP